MFIATKATNHKLTIAQFDQCNVLKTYFKSAARNRLPQHQKKNTPFTLDTEQKWKGRKQRGKRREVKQSTCLGKTVRKTETMKEKRKVKKRE